MGGPVKGIYNVSHITGNIICVCFKIGFFKISYCNHYDPSKKDEWCDICREFVDVIARHRPDMLMKQDG